MRRFTTSLKIGLMSLAVAMFVGCGSQQPASPPAGDTAADEHAHEGEDAHAHGDEHDHSHEGPHGGHVVEIGSPNHHAEVLHDTATHTVYVYVLDSAAATNVPVAVEAVTINAMADGKPQQFTLAANSMEGEAAGSTSRFELVDEGLCDGLAGGWDPHSSTARLSITIDGKPYVGDIELHEEGEEHAHDHAE
jgi:hypothetical protein